MRGEDHVDGLNIGVNVGEAAGQTVSQGHVHVVPRHASYKFALGQSLLDLVAQGVEKVTL